MVSVMFVAVIWLVLSGLLILICLRGLGAIAFDARGIILGLLVAVLTAAWICIPIQMVRYFRRKKNG